MADERLRIIKTLADVLIFKLRGEVGEVLAIWLLLRHFMSSASRLQTNDPTKDMANKELGFLWLLKEKLQNELIARLSELADEKIGRTNFYFATRKLNKLQSEAGLFSKYLISKKLRQKRNQEIAHRELPEQWPQEGAIHISYRTLVKATVMALRLMKQIDRSVLGPAAPFLWREVRKKRYELTGPPRAMYMLVPYFNLSGEDRVRIVQEEQLEGKIVWTEIETMIDGKPQRLLVCKEWGIVFLGNGCLALPRYPLQSIDSIDFGIPPNSPSSNDEEASDHSPTRG